MRTFIRRLALIVGLTLCTYPLAASILEQKQQENVISTYQRELENQEDSFAACIEDARKYNDMLYQAQGFLVSELNGILGEESYQNQLNLSGNGIMGTIEIPKINVNLPIYHGTEEDVLSNGAGHFEGTSLPAGGVNTHCVLTGHRGLPNSKLFTRLDELEEGDLFYVRVCNETLAYRVIEIQVIEPEELGCLSIQPEKDLFSLITCHPYGINTHRLVVTGERTTYKETEYLSIQPQMASMRELFFMVLPFALIGIAAITFIRERKERDKNAE